MRITVISLIFNQVIINIDHLGFSIISITVISLIFGHKFSVSDTWMLLSYLIFKDVNKYQSISVILNYPKP